MAINTVSQLVPIIVIIVGLYFHSTWDKGLRGIFYFYFVSGLLEVVNEIIGGLPIIYHLSTINEGAFLLYIFSRWSNFSCKEIFIIFFIISIFLKVSGIEPLYKIDILSTVLLSLIFIFAPLFIVVEKSHQKFFIFVMSIYYGGSIVSFITSNVFKDPILAWKIHSVFNIFAALGSATVFFIRENEILDFYSRCMGIRLLPNSKGDRDY